MCKPDDFLFRFLLTHEAGQPFRDVMKTQVLKLVTMLTGAAQVYTYTNSLSLAWTLINYISSVVILFVNSLIIRYLTVVNWDLKKILICLIVVYLFFENLFLKSIINVAMVYQIIDFDSQISCMTRSNEFFSQIISSTSCY